MPTPIIKLNVVVTDPPAMSSLKKITSPPIVKHTPSVVQFTPTAKVNPKKMSTIVDIVNRKRAKSLRQEKRMHRLARMMDYSTCEDNDDIEILPQKKRKDSYVVKRNSSLFEDPRLLHAFFHPLNQWLFMKRGCQVN